MIETNSIMNKEQELISAVKNDYSKVVQELLANLNNSDGFNINSKDKLGLSALHYAIKSKNKCIISLLLDSNADIDIQDINGFTPLIATTEQCNYDIAKLLLARGANVNIKDIYGFTALIVAAKSGSVEIVELLLQSQGIRRQFIQDSINQSSDSESNAKYSVVPYDLSNEIAVDAVEDVSGETALMCAASVGYLAIVDLLVRAGADLNIQNIYGYTALAHAVKGDNYKIVVYLLKHKANINMRNTYGNTPIMMAIEEGNLRIVEILIKFNAVTDCKNIDGDTVLIVAAKRGQKDMLRLLIESNLNIDLTTRNRGNHNALYYLKSNKQILKFVIQLINWKKRKSLMFFLHESQYMKGLANSQTKQTTFLRSSAGEGTNSLCCYQKSLTSSSDVNSSDRCGNSLDKETAKDSVLGDIYLTRLICRYI